MALDPATLALALAPTLKTAHLTVGAENNAALDLFCQNLAIAIATAVVAHITTAAVVVPGTMVVGPTAVTGAGKVT